MWCFTKDFPCQTGGERRREPIWNAFELSLNKIWVQALVQSPDFKLPGDVDASGPNLS